nr:plasmid recombination protein [Mycoplasma yeatsii]
MYHKTTKSGSKQEQKANSLADINKWLSHNHRTYSNQANSSYCYSAIDTSKTPFNFNLEQFEAFLYEQPRETYKEWFNNQIPQEVLDEYNNKQTRKDRKITDYFEYIEKQKNKQGLAEQMIIGVGSQETLGEINQLLVGNEWYNNYWKGYTIELKKELQRLIPDFKIYDTTLHLDETTPHIHIIGAGFTYTPEAKQGLKVRLASSRIFTPTSLEYQHQELRKFNEKQLNKLTNLLEQHNITYNPRTKKIGQNETKRAQKIELLAEQENKEISFGINDKQLSNTLSYIQNKQTTRENRKQWKKDLELFKSHLQPKNLKDLKNTLIYRLDQELEKKRKWEQDIKKLEAKLERKENRLNQKQAKLDELIAKYNEKWNNLDKDFNNLVRKEASKIAFEQYDEQVRGYKNQKIEFEGRAYEAEAKLEQERENHQKELANKEQQINHQRMMRDIDLERWEKEKEKLEAKLEQERQRKEIYKSIFDEYANDELKKEVENQLQEKGLSEKTGYKNTLKM